jgi:N-acetylneuraminic acid mutarotase
MERIARETKNPAILRELFNALGNDPYVIAECLVRPILVDQLSDQIEDFDSARQSEMLFVDTPPFDYHVPEIAGGNTFAATALQSAASDSWAVTAKKGAPRPAATCCENQNNAVWTGTEMLVWGTDGAKPYAIAGGRYDPSTNSWRRIAQKGAPSRRIRFTSVWTGTEMIIWGGIDPKCCVDFFPTVGGRYNPLTNSWTPTATTGAPETRARHTAVWSGKEMIIWGGNYDFEPGEPGNGGRYDPSSDSWKPIKMKGAPMARTRHTAVWNGKYMIIWGGYGFRDLNDPLNTGGLYNPKKDTWKPVTTTGAPEARDFLYGSQAIWTGNEMIVWGGWREIPFSPLNTGGRYNPKTNSWSATTTTGAPSARSGHALVWTGQKMIVWGGNQALDAFDQYDPTNTGGLYDPSTDSWTGTTTTNAPSARTYLSAVWTGTQMMIWGGGKRTGGLYTP